MLLLRKNDYIPPFRCTKTMNSSWQDFLHAHGATIEDGRVKHFHNSAKELNTTRDGNIICDLSQFGTLKIHGTDAGTFLQNMVSSDVMESAQHAQISSLNNPKGRVLTTMMIWHKKEDYFLHLPRSLCAIIQKRLSMYVLRAQVKIEDISDQQISMGVSGPVAAALLHSTLGPVPHALWGVEHYADTSVICVGINQFQLHTTAQLAPTLWQQLNISARPAGSTCWDWLTIRSGIPVILPATQEQFVAQMINLELIGGVSFKKGCYPGQEIVARMQYLGKLKRRMYLAHIQGNIIPQPGDELFSTDMEGQPVGMVVNASPAPEGGWDTLAVVQISSRESHTVHHLSQQGTALQFMPLPYSIQPDQSQSIARLT